ncbi:2'-5' RNA ligase [Chitinophaga costaii]|uniref:2'-5' RNA ligase n=1 Tax=Chitinophaga costaii TaxID=1335309 RepID=A0A1C4E567_9BACT|nr:2'-5' RNA ligase family protein [Chitinophaga costaii]PUZ24320.1 2'-5' RNA ligase family protein [Chitinophaga costaii]SCC38661.1 2'-5' RNA ligase [Chitinophaga costaii]
MQVHPAGATHSTFLEEEKTFDYLLVIHPDSQVSEDVKGMKMQLANALGYYNSQFSNAYISLFRSEFPERFEASFIDMLETVSRRQHGFTIYTSRLEKFDLGNSKHTIYVNVANPKPVTELHRKIMQLFSIGGGQFKPHITVARAINSAQLEKVHPHVHNQLFVRSFECHGFLLLRKPVRGGHYEVVKAFTFGDTEAQGNTLFNHAA